MNGTILAADIGTTSLKAAVVDENGQFVAYSQQFLSLRNDSTAAQEWLPALRAAWRDMQKQLSGNKAPFAKQQRPSMGTEVTVPAGICISGNGPTIVSADGRTLLWNQPIDTPAHIKKAVGQSLFLPRIQAFLTRYPDVAHSSCIFSGPEYLIYQLCGAAVTILPEARYRTAYWTDEQLDALSIAGDRLPPFVAPATRAGMTDTAITAQFGFGRPVPVFCGGPDFIAAMVGTNSLSPGAWYDCAGSSEGLNLCVSEPVTASHIRVLPSIQNDLWNAAALESESGRMFSSYRSAVESLDGRTYSYSELIEKCLAHTTGDGYDVLARIARNFRTMVERIRAVARNGRVPLAPYIAVTGGQAKNDAWMQFKCTAAGVPLAVCNHPDAELIGDAVFAQTGLGRYRSIAAAAAALVTITRRYEP